MTRLSKLPAKIPFLFCTLFCLSPCFVFSQQVDTAWVRRYNGPGNGDDKAVAVAVDSGGNVYVTGSSLDSTTGYDYCTIKYLPNGDTGWVRRYNGPDNLDDFALQLVLDDSGYAYVTGTSSINYPAVGCSGGHLSSYTTIKYTPNGDTVWARRFHRPVCCDSATSLAVDKNSSVYVTGMSSEYCALDLPDNQYQTIKYAPNGDTVWVRHFTARLCTAANAHLTINENGNVYVAAGGPDYVTVKYDSNGNQLWLRTYNGPSNGEDFARAIVVDSNGNAYITGVSDGDILTIKYDSLGNQLWVARFASYWSTLNYLGGYGLAVDKSGNVLVTGSAWDIEAPVGFTIKYDSAGNQLWSRGMGLNHGIAIVVDSTGNAYVVSNTYYNSVVKYDPSGNVIWNKSNSPTLNDITLDSSRNVYVTGTDGDFFAVKYSPLPQIKGDLNLDGVLSTADVVLILNCAFTGDAIPAAPAACDINCDGRVSATDVVILLNMVFAAAPAPC